jgi:phosphoglycolate phosphatase-like HAD superfamily hydrolase
MYQRDYIMRMIEAFARMIAAILGLREKGDLDKARALVEEAYETILKINSGEIKQYDKEQWRQFCIKRTPEELEMLADLLKVEGEIMQDSGKAEEGSSFFYKALELLKLVEAQSGTYSLTRAEKISELEQKLF